MSRIEPIAVVRMAGLFPGAHSSDEFWSNVHSGKDAITDVPAGRWEVKPEDIFTPGTNQPDRTYARRGGFVHGFQLDPTGIHLPTNLLMDLDPLFWWVLSVGRDLFAREGLNINRERTGVVLANLMLASDSFAALGRTGLREVARAAKLPHADALPDEKRPAWINHYQSSLPAGLLARSLGLNGGTMALDAACASSLYAVKLACDQLRAGAADAMIAGGVTRTDHLCLAVGFSQLRAISKSGRARPFDAGADGLIPGEGCGLVLLKRLSDAQADNDEILAVIRGVGLSNDGRGRGVLMPMSEGQVRAMNAAYAEAGLDPSTVGHVECHATGTPVGDTAEINSLKMVWGKHAFTGTTALGSVKSMVGHLLTAAGMAGLIKSIQALRHKALPPTLNFERLPPGVDLTGSPFVINTRAQPWPDPPQGQPRRAACSAFGFGGCNAHVILEEAPARKSTPRTEHPPRTNHEPLAIVAMASRFGVAANVEAYRELLFEGHRKLGTPPSARWFGVDGDKAPLPALPGGYMGQITLHDPLSLRIPPAEIDRMLPQQLLALMVADDLMEDSGALERIKDRGRMGVVVGMAMEADAGDYAFRWATQRDAIHAKDGATGQALTAIANALTSPITAEPVLGFLGNLIANRISSRFDLGGPSLSLAAEETSALKALEVAALMLRRGEVDAMLVGGVDLPGDIRALKAVDAVQGWSRSDIRVFDKRADGSVPGEGAGMIIIKRLKDAQNDGDRILGVVRGIGAASDGAHGAVATPSSDAHVLAISRALTQADVEPDAMGLIAVHGSGRPREDGAEIEALHSAFKGTGSDAGFRTPRCALIATKPVVGHTGAASGMASLIAATLSLHHRALPPTSGLEDLAQPQQWTGSPFYVLRKARPWLADHHERPRLAGVSAMGVDGNHVHVILEEGPRCAEHTVLGASPEQLFLVRGNTREELVNGLRALKQQSTGADLERLAQQRAQTPAPSHGLTVSVVCADAADLVAKIDKAITQIQGGTARIEDVHGIYFAQDPLSRRGKLAFVFPGAGTAYAGMARETVLRFPELEEGFARKTTAPRSRSMERWTLPRTLVSRRAHARDEMRSVQEMIWGAGYYTQMLCDAIRYRMGVHPQAALGYSLGESSGLFALGAWTAIDEMHVRLATWPLFTTELAGPMEAVLRVWQKRGINVDRLRSAPFWSNCLLVAPPDQVIAALKGEQLVHLAIINSPDECVISGETESCKRVVERLKCSAHITPFPAAVHVPEVEEMIDEYRRMHTMPTQVPEGVTYYSSGSGKPYAVTPENVAESIVRQAIRSVDFPALVNNSYNDGVRLYVEVGPRGSCTRWIERILQDREFMAIASDRKGRSEYVNLLHLAGALAAHGVPITLDKLYQSQVAPPVRVGTPAKRDVLVGRMARVTAPAPQPAAPAVAPLAPKPVTAPLNPPPPVVASKPVEPIRHVSTPPSVNATPSAVTPPPAPRVAPQVQTSALSITMPNTDNKPTQLVPAAIPAAPVMIPSAPAEGMHTWAEALGRTWSEVSRGHQTFLDGTRMATEALVRMAALAGGSSVQGSITVPHITVAPSPMPSMPPPVTHVSGNGSNRHAAQTPVVTPAPQAPPANVSPRPVPPGTKVVYDYEQCLEFADGKIGKVFGPDFAAIDGYGVRVRLPSPPLLLCHRVTDITGVPNSMKPGTMDTESDHKPDDFFVYRNTIPCGITVESGQADLMLVSYLGIDHIVKGQKRYRLLDCDLTFFDLLPKPGDTLHYHIVIDRFVEQSGTHIFFFRYDLTVGDRVILRMRNGCAGFFSQEALATSHGIVLPPGYKPKAKRPPRGEVVKALCKKNKLTDEEFTALTRGDVYGCFGEGFEIARTQPNPLALPGGQMKLLHRITRIEPEGGSMGLGFIEAETDVHPDDWFFPCHFKDDEVMAGSLMYETCVQTLQTFMLHLGHGLEYPDGTFHPMIGETARVKCRGQVVTSTKKIVYRLDIMERGTDPEPYAIAEANCFADDFHQVRAENLSLRLVGPRIPLPRQTIQSSAAVSAPPSITGGTNNKPVFTREQIIEHGVGTPSHLWGPDYAVFDTQRRMARLPNGPYLMLDRISAVGQPPRTLKPGVWLEGEYDVPQQAWYFDANGHPTMPFSLLLEAFLQPCGFLASYVGSDLRCKEDRRFRNLGGHATQYMDVLPGSGTLHTRATLTKFSEYGDMLVVNYDACTTQNGRKVIEGSSYFGFFTDTALAEQKGLNGKMQPGITQGLPAPMAASAITHPALRLAQPPLLMFDRLVAHDPSGGRHGKGYARAEKTVDPNEWFFKAHFHQDPVTPGSLGVEGLLQLMQVCMMRMEPHATNMRFEPVMLGRPWDWTYRGQVIGTNKLVTMEVEIVDHGRDPKPWILADAFLMVDGLPIYRLDGVGMRMVPRS